jgi:RNA polymerase sigma-70 factor (ECF subfamily)
MERAPRQATFDDWLRAHQGLLLRIVRAYAFTPHDRDDLLQMIALELWDSIPRFRGEAKVTTWIYRVALRCAMSWSQRERVHREGRQPLAEVAEVLAPTPEEQDPRLEWVYARIARLEPVDRSLVLLHLDGLSYREIAETLGISEGHVGVKLSRVKKAMSGQIAERSSHGL